MKNFRIKTLAVAIACVGATSVSASTVELTYQESGNPFGSPSLFEAVTISSPDYNGNVRAGPFRMTGSDGIGDFDAFCVDLAHSLSSGQTYTVQAASVFSTSVTDNISSLFNTAYDDVTSSVNGAAFQVALWEIITDTAVGLDVYSGAFTASANMAVTLQATNYLNGLGASVSGGYDVTYMTSDFSQDLVTVSAIPVPAAFGMLSLGLAGLFGLRRRKKA